MSKENGGPAFPERCDSGFDVAGMSLRDYFAAAAIAFVMPMLEGTTIDANNVAENCYRIADAMLKIRER